MLFLHPQVIGFAPILLVAALLSVRHFGFRPILWGGALSLAVALPYLLYDAQNGFVNSSTLLAVALNGEKVTDFNALRYVAAMASAAGFPDILHFTYRLPAAFPDLTMPNGLATALFGLGVALCLGRTVTCVRQRAWRRDPGYC